MEVHFRELFRTFGASKVIEELSGVIHGPFHSQGFERVQGLRADELG